MRDYRFNHSAIGMMLMLMVMIAISLTVPITAQDGMFATNTPVGAADTETDSNVDAAPAMFATNTPEGMTTSAESDTDAMESSSQRNRPEALLFNYATRFWLEADFVNLVQEQVTALDSDDTDIQLAVNFLLYELEQRFPSAPTDPMQREQLLAAMMNTPLGALDMRQIMRPFVQTKIDADPMASFIESNGFEIALTPANLDGSGEFDRIVNIRYADDSGIRYEEYLLAVANDSGSYTILPTSYDLPSVPFDGVNNVSVEYSRDVNSDSLDELVLRVDDGNVSDRLFVIGYRNGNAIDLVDPALELRVGEIVNWNFELAAPVLTVLEYQAESLYPDWECLNQIEYSWTYERNLYRRSQDMNAQFTNVDSLGCTLANADLFTLPVSDAVSTIEGALVDYGFDNPSGNRALMTLAMFYIFEGRLDDARNTAQSIITVDEPSTWESRQADALIRASNSAGNTALDICEAVAIASDYPACDMNAVIGNYLNFVTLTTDDDLETQLSNLGFPVLEKAEVSEIGRATRTVVLFEYFSSEWWGFYASGDGTYAYEPAEAPFEFGESVFPMGLIEAPQAAIVALLVDDDPTRVIAILNNTIRENPTTPLAPSTLYLQALAADFTGDRETARALYYQIWDEYPDRIWAEIAAPHLELR